MQQHNERLQWSHRGFTALASEAITAGHQVVSIWRDITVRLDVLLGWKSVGHLPCAAVPHPEHKNIPEESHSQKQAQTVCSMCTFTTRKKV